MQNILGFWEPKRNPISSEEPSVSLTDIEALLVMKTGGEFLQTKKPPSLKVLNEGNKAHNHKLELADEWDAVKLGPSVTDFGEYTANFHALRKCECGYEDVLTHRALY